MNADEGSARQRRQGMGMDGMMRRMGGGMAAWA